MHIFWIKYLLISVFLSSFFLHFHRSDSTNVRENYINYSVSKAKELIENNTDLFILDVRTKSEYEKGHIAGAYLIPHLEIIGRQDELPENKSRTILVYCELGGRSVTASNTLESLNYSMIYNMVGGFDAWKNAGYSFETGPFVIPNTNTTLGSTVVKTEFSSKRQALSSPTTPSTTPAFEFIFIFQAIGLLLICKKERKKRIWRTE